MGPIICQLLGPLGRQFIPSPLTLSNEPYFILIPKNHAINNNSPKRITSLKSAQVGRYGFSTTTTLWTMSCPLSTYELTIVTLHKTPSGGRGEGGGRKELNEDGQNVQTSSYKINRSSGDRRNPSNT